MLRSPHDHDNGQAITARQAAEALFAPKKEPRSREPESEVAHKPRILAAQPPARRAVVRAAVVTPHQEPRRAIPKAQVDRIRTWVRYGMTIHQAADACGVSVSELKDALRPGAW